MKILGISGSLSTQSSNARLLHDLAERAPTGVALGTWAGLGELPLFSPDLDPPGSVAALRSALEGADAVLFACPEYGHSLPGALKNAIDWLIGSCELNGKWVAITAAARHRTQGRRGRAALRTTLAAVDAVVVWDAPIVADELERAAPSLFAALSHGRRLPRPRTGFSTVTPRLVVEDLGAAVAFMKSVLGAVGETTPDRPAELTIGDSRLMVSSAGPRPPFPAFLYVYVDDADRAYQSALAAGATTLEEPLDTPYGDRRAMVRDPQGNVWQLAHVLPNR